MKAIETYRKNIKKLCKTYHVDVLFIFDAALLNESKPCKCGFIVRFAPMAPEEYGDNYYALKNELKKMMGCELELIEEKALKNPFMRKIIDASKTTLYGRQDKGMAV